MEESTDSKETPSKVMIGACSRQVLVLMCSPLGQLYEPGSWRVLVYGQPEQFIRYTATLYYPSQQSTHCGGFLVGGTSFALMLVENFRSCRKLL